MRNHTVFYPTPTNFVVRTYVNPKLLRPEQHEIVREMEAWLAVHQAEAEVAVMKYHRLEDNDQGEFLDAACWATLQADFQALWSRLSALFQPLPASAGARQPRPASHCKPTRCASSFQAG